MSTSVVGRRFSRRTVLVNAAGEPIGATPLDPEALHLLRPELLTAFKAAAVDVLLAAGIDVDSVLARALGQTTNPGEWLREHVASIAGVEHDDDRALAARIFELCCALELLDTDPAWRDWAAARGAPMRWAFELGRLSMLRKAYAVDAAQRAAAAGRPRPKRRDRLRDRVIAQMARAKRDGQTLKIFLAAWQRDPVDDLRLRFVADRYEILDEGETSEVRRRSLATLADWWTEAG